MDLNSIELKQIAVQEAEESRGQPTSPPTTQPPEHQGSQQESRTTCQMTIGAQPLHPVLPHLPVPSRSFQQDVPLGRKMHAAYDLSTGGT